MKTNWILASLTVIVLSLATLGVTGCKTSEPTQSGTHLHQYTCPMHPEVVKDAPGDCPKCGMKLVDKH